MQLYAYGIKEFYIDNVNVAEPEVGIVTAYNQCGALRDKNASSTGENGLRIYNKIETGWMAQNRIVEFGSVSLRTQRLKGAELTLENGEAGVAYSDGTFAEVTDKIWEETETAKIFTSYLTNINEDFYDENYSIRAYAKSSDGTVIYGDVCEVSVYEILNAIDKGNTADGSEQAETDVNAFNAFTANNTLYYEWCESMEINVGKLYAEKHFTYTEQNLKFTEIDEYIKREGRTAMVGGGLKFGWTNAGFTVAGVFEGDVTLDVNASAEMICYTIVDGDYDNPVKTRPAKGQSTVTIAENLSKGYHTLYFLKSSDAGSDITAEQINFTGELTRKLPNKKLRIEFIGDSVTSSTSLWKDNDDDPNNELDNLELSNSLLGFPSLVARGINADLSVISKSGHCISAKPDLMIMNHYNYSIYGDRSAATAWNFNSNPETDIVVVALGTNDTPTYMDDQTGLIAGINNLLNTVRAKNPNATIIFTYGMMATNLADVYENTATAWARKDGNAFYKGLTRGNYCTGLAGHPNPDGHKYNADVLINFIKENNLDK